MKRLVSAEFAASRIPFSVTFFQVPLAMVVINISLIFALFKLKAGIQFQ